MIISALVNLPAFLIFTSVIFKAFFGASAGSSFLGSSTISASDWAFSSVDDTSSGFSSRACAVFISAVGAASVTAGSGSTVAVSGFFSTSAFSSIFGASSFTAAFSIFATTVSGLLPNNIEILSFSLTTS